MPVNPSAMTTLPNGHVVDPNSLASVPADAATTRYVLSVDLHPDAPEFFVCDWIPITTIIAEPTGSGYGVNYGASYG